MTISRLDAILRFGAVVLAAVALAMLFAPAAIGSLFGVDSSSGGDFLARRYGASGMAALAAALWTAPVDNARRTVLIAVAVWSRYRQSSSSQASRHRCLAVGPGRGR